MPRTLKFSLGLSLVLLFLVGLFLGIGLVQDAKYSGNVSETINVKSEVIWNYLIDVQDMPNRRKEVTSVEILRESESKMPLEWKENTDMGGYMTFRLGERTPHEKLEVLLVESSYKMLGKWTYQLNEKNGLTTVTITEESEISSPLIRGAYFLAGRDSTLKQEMSMIRNHFKNLK
jgi:hypothetical protein